MPPTPPRQLDVRHGYDCWAPSYDDHDPSTRLDEPRVRALWGDVTGKRILDMGCGTGRYARLLAADGARVVGLDVSEGMLRRAMSQANTAGGRWVCASVERLPFAAAIFDLVTCGLVIDHVSDLDALFAGIARLLTPGGRLILTSVHPRSQHHKGPQVAFDANGHSYGMAGIIHEESTIMAAAKQAKFTIAVCQSLQPDAKAKAAHAAWWADRTDGPALLLLAADKVDGA